MAHMVHCVKFKKEMPGLDEPPFDNDLGQEGVRQRVPGSVEDVDGALQDAAERVPAESGAARGSGSDRQAVGAIFLRRRLGQAEGVCAAGEVADSNFEVQALASGVMLHCVRGRSAPEEWDCTQSRPNAGSTIQLVKSKRKVGERKSETRCDLYRLGAGQ